MLWSLSNSLLTSYRIQADIRGSAIDISDNYFITCLYPKDSGDPEDIEKLYLRGMLLVKVCGYCHIFFCFPSHCYRHIVLYSLPLPPPRLLRRKQKMDPAARSKHRCHRRRQQRVTWQPFSGWRAKSHLVPSHMLWSWCIQQMLLFSLIP